MNDAVETPPLANAVQLLQAIIDAIAELQTLDPASAGNARAIVHSKALGELTHDYLTDLLAKIRECRASPRADEPQLSHLERDYGLFIDAIPEGRKLVDDIESLGLSSGFTELVERAERVFVNRLGYTRARLDESSRTSRIEFGRIERLGTFGELDIVCVELSRRNWYATFYDVIFRFHPYALLLSQEPHGGALRFVYREGPSKPPRYRTLTGPQSDWEPNDNLLVWAWRLHELRPQIGETAQTLQRRVSRALELSPEDVGRDWPSIAIDTATPVPGVPWEEAPRRAFESFVQLGCAEEKRRRWGLEAVFRDRFPLPVSKRNSIWIRYSTYQLGEAPPSIDECVDKGWSRERNITLLLDIESADDTRRVRLNCRLPEPDTSGRFVLDGVPYAFAAEVRDDGRLTALPEDPVYAPLTDDEEELEEIEEDLDSGAEDVESASLDLQEGSDKDEPADKPTLRGFRGLSPRAFYEYAVSRKLAGLSYTLWRLVLEPDKSPVNQIVGRTLRYGRRITYLPLAASTVLRRFLAPHPAVLSIRAQTWRVASSPPSWSCLDSSSATEGHFYPIAAARMHPTGSLAVPLEHGSRIRMCLTTKSATDVNPRALRVQPIGGPDWWSAHLLRSFAHLSAGAIQAPEMAARSSVLKARVASRNGAEPRAWVVESLSLPPPTPHRIYRRVPGSVGNQPTLLVEPGTYVGPGKPWLRVAAKSWPGMHGNGNTPEENLATDVLVAMDRVSLANTIRQSPQFDECIPAGLAGVVSSVSLEPVVGPLGAPVSIERSWIARIELRPFKTFDGAVIGPDGTMYPVAGARTLEDMPFDANGQPFDVLLETPRAQPHFDHDIMDGATGDPFGASTTIDGWRWVYWSRSTTSAPDQCLRFRSVDGEGIPAHDCSPSISEHERLRWLVLDSATAQPLLQASSRSGQPCWTTRFRSAAEAAGFPMNDELVASPRPPTDRIGDIPDPLVSRMKKPLPLPETGASLPLPIDVIHPWRKEAAAAILGVTSPELDQLLEAHGLVALTKAIRHTVGADPYEAALRRIESDTERRTKALLGSGLHRLRAIPRDALEEKLLFRAVPLPAPSLLLVGFPPGAGRALRTPLLRRYREIKYACAMVEKFRGGPTTVEQLAECELQRSVDALFGPRAGSAALGHDLAGWLTRLWPLTRPPQLPSATTNLGLAATTTGPVPAIVHGASRTIAPMYTTTRRASDPSWWREEAARSHLVRERLCWFIGLFACLDLPSTEGRFLDVESPTGALSEWASREWLARIERSDSRPSGLLLLLERTVPLQLPTETRPALTIVDAIVRDAIPGDDAAGLRLRLILARILSGFWFGVPSEVAPSGWLWHGFDTPPPQKARRYVPPFGSPAWSSWPCIESAVCAPQLVLDLDEGRPIPTLLRIVGGFFHQTKLDPSHPISAEPTTPTPGRVQEEGPSIPALSPPPSPPPGDAAPLPSDSDVGVSTLSLRQWLQALPLQRRPVENT